MSCGGVEDFNLRRFLQHQLRVRAPALCASTSLRLLAPTKSGLRNPTLRDCKTQLAWRISRIKYHFHYTTLLLIQPLSICSLAPTMHLSTVLNQFVSLPCFSHVWVVLLLIVCNWVRSQGAEKFPCIQFCPNTFCSCLNAVIESWCGCLQGLSWHLQRITLQSLPQFPCDEEL